MDWKNMSDIEKKLTTAFMIGDMFHEYMGVLLKKDTKITVGDEEFHYNGPEVRATKGSIIEFGTTKEDKSAYEVLEAHDNTVVLKKVVFFKAQLVTNYSTIDEYCVVAVDKNEAFKIIKNYASEHKYIRILSLNPSKFFKNIVR